MPLPRFHRLPEDRQQHILAVATDHIAHHGPADASYSQIVADAGISRTSAYLYFDGKPDLVAEVYRALQLRLSAHFTPWTPCADADELFARLAATSRALQRHLVDTPADLALLAHAPAAPAPPVPAQPGSASAPIARPGDAPLAAADAWLAAMLADGRRLGVVRRDIPNTLMLAATRGVLQAGDRHVIEAMRAGIAVSDAPVWSLLRSLWSPPTTEVDP